MTAPGVPRPEAKTRTPPSPRPSRDTESPSWVVPVHLSCPHQDDFLPPRGDPTSVRCTQLPDGLQMDTRACEATCTPRPQPTPALVGPETPQRLSSFCTHTPHVSELGAPLNALYDLVNQQRVCRTSWVQEAANISRLRARDSRVRREKNEAREPPCGHRSCASRGPGRTAESVTQPSPSGCCAGCTRGGPQVMEVGPPGRGMHPGPRGDPREPRRSPRARTQRAAHRPYTRTRGLGAPDGLVPTAQP